MPPSGRYFKTAPAKRRRGPSVEEFFFKMGGFTGALRRIIRDWERPFTVNQLKIELHRRHPKIIPAEHQVEDIVEWFVFSKQIESIDEGTFRKIPFRAKPIKAEPVPRRPQLNFVFG